MDALFIPLTKCTPEVLFRPDAGMFLIIGSSYPENPFKFYEPIIKWMNEYLSTEQVKSLIIHLELIYVNTASTMQIMKLLKLLKTKLGENNVTINWHYNLEDIDLLEEGKRFEHLSKLKFIYNEQELR